MSRKSQEEPGRNPLDDYGIKRRDFLIGLGGFAAGVGVKALFTGNPKAAPSVPVPVAPEGETHLLTTDEAVAIYTKLEKFIEDEQAQAHKDGKKLKIMLGDSHSNPLYYLMALMTYDIARRKDIAELSVEMPKEQVAAMNTYLADARRQDFRQDSSAAAQNIDNLAVYAASLKTKLPGIKAPRGIDNDAQAIAQMRQYMPQTTDINLDELKNPDLWKKKMAKAIPAIYAADMKREKTMVEGLTSDTDEMTHIGVAHIAGVVKNLPAEKFRVAVLMADQEFLIPEETYATVMADQIVSRVGTMDLHARAKIDPAYTEKCKAALFPVVKQGYLDYINSSYFQESRRFIAEHGHSFFDGVALPPEKRSARGVLEILREVKRKLGHAEVVALPTSDSQRGLG